MNVQYISGFLPWIKNLRAPVSVIIPTLNAEGAFAPLLSSLFEGLDSGVIREVIVADGGSDDATVIMAEKVGCMVVTGAEGRGEQICNGILVAKGDWLLILHADSVLEAGWSIELDRYFDKPSKAWYFDLKFDSPHAMARVTSAWANRRARWFGLPYGDQGLLVNRDLLTSVGGYAELPLMEDVATAQRLKGRLNPLPFTVTTSAARYESLGWFRQGTKNIWRLLRYYAGASPESLARDYDRP